MDPSDQDFFQAMEATWPAAQRHRKGQWTVREGRGGGKRVSAATSLGVECAASSVETAEHAMRALGQTPLFMITPGQNALDETLAQRGYELVDPVAVYAVQCDALTADIPLTAVVPSWPALAVQKEIWFAGGIAQPRLKIMERVTVPKTTLLGRTGDNPAGTAFAALHSNVAMIHAVEVAFAWRRKGVGRYLLQASANWSKANGADWIALAVTKVNTEANALYRKLGMRVVAEYHYRRDRSDPV